jgi:RNA polymerase sigma-70 factor (ECF subfamily)
MFCALSTPSEQYLSGGYTPEGPRAFMTQRMDRTVAIGKEGGGSEPEASSAAGFESFFLTEHVRLYRALYVITGSTHEAEELMQEAFVRIWERWDRVAGMEDPAAYLYRTAMNEFRSRYRRARAAAKRALKVGEPRDLFAEADDRDVVAQALRKLAPRQRAALVLTQLLDLSSEEAGRLLGVSAASVRALVYQGRVAMAENLEVDDA